MEKDEEKILSRKRLEKWVKIFLIFLAFMWLCTIISKSIYVAGLPKVTTDTPSKKYVEHIVEADGIVTADGEVAVNTQSGLRVDRIYVRQGDTVEEGDVLFTLDLTDIASVISTKETELSRLQCSLSDVQVNAVIEAQKREIAILWAQEDYETADKETAIEKERAKQALDKAVAELEKHLATTVPYTPDSARQDAWNAYHDWINRGYSISDKITAKERAIRELEEQLAALGQSEEKEQEPEKEKETEKETDKESESEQEKEPEKESENEQDKETGTKTESQTESESEEKPDDAETNADTKTETETETETDTNTDTGADIHTGMATLSGSAGENQNSSDDEKRKELQNKIKKANRELLALKDEQTRHDRENVSQPDYAEEELKYDTWQSTKLALEENVQRAKENYNDVSYAREVTLRQKMRDIANAQVTARADSTAVTYELDIRQLQSQLAALYALKKQNGEIRAQEGGTISGIRVEVGGRTSDTAAVLLTDTSRPCQFKFDITKEQGKYLHLGDGLELRLNGQTKMDVTADYFAENMQGGYEVLCNLPEGVGKPGLSGSIQRTVSGELHNLTLPIEAVFEETGSYYVYTLNEKSGILGSEYYAEKIKVQIEDKNDRYAALEPGAVSSDTQVITYSTESLEQGESVRPQGK